MLPCCDQLGIPYVGDVIMVVLVSWLRKLETMTMRQMLP